MPKPMKLPEDPASRARIARAVLALLKLPPEMRREVIRDAKARRAAAKTYPTPEEGSHTSDPTDPNYVGTYSPSPEYKVETDTDAVGGGKPGDPQAQSPPSQDGEPAPPSPPNVS